MLVHIKDIVTKSIEEDYVVGAFNIHNLESTLGIGRAAMKMKSSAIIQVSEGTIKYMGLDPVFRIVSHVANNIFPEVPIALHLDHGKSIESALACIEAGFSSVHIDGSSLSLEENIKLTKPVVEKAHSKGIWVQGEVGAMIGGHGKISGEIKDIPIAKLEDVVKFVKETGVDTIAAAVGTAHGVYDNEDVIIPLLKDIKRETKKPFVLHGGSGVKEEKIKEAIKSGVNIINIGSDIKIAFSRTLIKNCAENKNETDPRNLLRPTIDAVAETVKKSMKLFGSDGRIDFGDTEG